MKTSLYDKPLASNPFDSYRYRGRYGYIAIGALSILEAISEAKRSTDNVDIRNLEKWNGSEWVSCFVSA